MAAIYEFPNEISCNHAISWSPDHRICFCTDKAIKILSLNCGVDNTEHKVRCHQNSFPVTADIFDIPQFTVKEHKFLMKNLSREDLKALNVERVLNPGKYQFENVQRTGFAAADWSPLGADDVGRSILATLSQDYRLCLFSHEPSKNEWSVVCDLSILRRTQTKPEFVLKSIQDYNSYKDWCFTQAVTVMKWCPSVFTDSEDGQKYMVLASGTKSGHIVMWKVKAPCQAESDCSVLYTVQPVECQVSLLQWSQHSDLLIAGYVDGQIQAMDLNKNNLTKEPICSSLYSESDLMKVSCMCIMENVKTDVYVLLINKEQCMLALQLSKASHTVISQSHIFLQSTQAASGMCVVTSNTVLMMSQDAILQKITVTIANSEMKLVSETLNLDLSGNTIWVSRGFCLSPNKVLTAYIIRPRPGFDHLAPKVKRSATKIHFKCLDDFNIGTHCRDDCIAKLTESPGSVGSMLDVLELYRQEVLNKNSLLIDDACRTAPLIKLKLKRYGVMVRYRSLKQKQADENTGKDLKKEMDEMMRMIIAIFIKSSVQNIDAEKVTSEPNREKNLAVVFSMHSWLEGSSDCLRDVEDITDTKQRLEKILGEADKEYCIQCCACSNNMKLMECQWTCDNGHSFDICCKTLLPVEGVNYKTCTVCYSHTRPPELLNDMKLKEFQWTCDNGHSFDICRKTLLPVEGVNYKTCTVCYSHARPPELLKDLQWLRQDSARCTFL